MTYCWVAAFWKLFMLAFQGIHSPPPTNVSKCRGGGFGTCHTMLYGLLWLICLFFFCHCMFIKIYNNENATLISGMCSFIYMTVLHSVRTNKRTVSKPKLKKTTTNSFSLFNRDYSIQWKKEEICLLEHSNIKIIKQYLLYTVWSSNECT